MTEVHRRQLFASDWFGLSELNTVVERLNAAMKQVLSPNVHGGYSGVVALHGPMGSGKTTLVNALCELWGVEGQTASATFGIVNTYKAGDWSVFHHDLYRLKSEDEAWELGLSEYFEADALNLVEWPERAPSLMPSDALLLELEVQGATDFPDRRVFLWQLKSS